MISFAFSPFIPSICQLCRLAGTLFNVYFKVLSHWNWGETWLVTVSSPVEHAIAWKSNNHWRIAVYMINNPWTKIMWYCVYKYELCAISSLIDHLEQCRLLDCPINQNSSVWNIDLFKHLVSSECACVETHQCLPFVRGWVLIYKEILLRFKCQGLHVRSLNASCCFVIRLNIIIFHSRSTIISIKNESNADMGYNLYTAFVTVIFLTPF